MISILIPTYNYNIVLLVQELYKQATELNIPFEILVYDDASTSSSNTENSAINFIDNCYFEQLPTNIGRSAIRNLLAKNAKFEFLLFLDADVKIVSNNFLSDYITKLNSKTQIIYGGIIYQNERPNQRKILRWIYGNKREALNLKKRLKKPYLSFLTLNFLINKNIFKYLKFNENIPNLRNEDLIFAMEAKKQRVLVEHIHNPVMHLGIENSELFLKKTIDTIHSFNFITSKGYLNPNNASLTRVGFAIEKLKLTFVFVKLHEKFNSYFQKNLLSRKPSLFIFDLFRLCYFLKIKTKE